MNYKDLSVTELAKLISPSSDAFLELKNRKVLRTKNIVGELGKYFAIDHYKSNPELPRLSIAPIKSKGINASSRNGETYKIKTVSSRKGTTGSFWDPKSIENNEKKFDYLLLVILDDSYSLDMILELTWNDFFKFKKFNKTMTNYSITITKELKKEVKIVYERK